MTKPFWARKPIPKQRDIAVLRPPSLPPEERFETPADARERASRTARLLRGAGIDALRRAAALMDDCVAGHYRCEQTICPRCARQFRRWFTSEALGANNTFPAAEIATIFLASAPEGELASLDIARHQAQLRAILRRLGFRGAYICGGTEVVYQAANKRWVLHVHVFAAGVPPAAWDRLRAALNPKWHDPVEVVPINDPPRQLSYLQKFATYHRPGRQTSSRRARAYPLPPARLRELALWFEGVPFERCLFSFGATRRGSSIVQLANGRSRGQQRRREKGI